MPKLPIKFQDNWPFVQGEEAKTDFQDGGHGGHLGFLSRTILAIFLNTSHPDASNQVSCQLAFHFRRSEKKIFKMVAILDFGLESF